MGYKHRLNIVFYLKMVNKAIKQGLNGIVKLGLLR